METTDTTAIRCAVTPLVATTRPRAEPARLLVPSELVEKDNGYLSTCTKKEKLQLVLAPIVASGDSYYGTSENLPLRSTFRTWQNKWRISARARSD